MIDVHQWAEIRRLHLSEGLGIKAIVKRTPIARNTVRAAIRSETPPAYHRPSRPSKLDPFKGEIASLLKDDEDIPGKRVLEILQGLGYTGGKSVLNEHLAQVRPLFRTRRVYQRTLYLPGRIGQWDLWEPVGVNNSDHLCDLRLGPSWPPVRSVRIAFLEGLSEVPVASPSG